MNTTATIACPSCTNPLTLDAPGAYRCPSCDHEFVWPPGFVKPAPTAVPPAREPAHIVTEKKWIGWPVIVALIGIGPFLFGLFALIAAISAVASTATKPGGGIGFGIGLLAILPLIFGTMFLQWANRLAKKFTCSECGNPVAKTSKLCPTCSARLG